MTDRKVAELNNEALEKVVGGKGKSHQWYCNKCGRKGTCGAQKPKQCPSCGSTNIRVS